MNVLISKSYVLNWQLDFAENYKFSKCGKCINTKTGKLIKKTMCGRSVGFCIQGKFYALNTVRKHLVKITENSCPF